MFQINNQLTDALYEKPIIAYCQNRNMKDIIGSITTVNYSVVSKPLKLLQEVSCKQCLEQTDDPCCK